MNAVRVALCISLLLPGLAQADPTTAVRDLRPGLVATVAGRVERITEEDEFRLADETGSILVYIGPNRLPVRTGDRVRVSGQVDDDDRPLEFYATEILFEDGRSVPLPNPD
ncbi:MAG: OB-fold nucleic acid binding domain-containing protein [Lamprobacter sp.]|uniref:OB-fold nucleic acid binding domain-containing protein n=1 Tax=Lamprobacter sp. TaxID=3100796 RepID=UPI002B262847|nr:OB-fold nucleic acid binding domain-containing protein [Lamprobacter sp.]MEA3643106.1 OB-fold nucleic acid binding domain-containing protein [Lamprobacter sp.]